MSSLLQAIGARQSNPTENNKATILAINGFFTGFALLIVVLRIYVRSMMLKTMGIDDYVIITAMLMGIGVFVCFIGETHWGIGRHAADISFSDMVNLLHWEFFHSIMVTLGISLIKISLAFFLLRLVPGKLYKRGLIGMIVFLILFTIASILTIIFACIPVEANWNLALVATSKCYSKDTFTDIGLFNSCVNILTDVLFATLPIPVVWNLQVNIRTRITLLCILSLGFFACACAITKTVLQSQVLTSPDSSFNDSYFIWNSIELYIGIAAASLPALRPLFASLLETTRNIATRRAGLGSSSNARHKYYMHEDGIGMDSLPRTSTRKGMTKNYDVQVTSRSALGGRSEEDIAAHWERSDSSEDILPVQGFREGDSHSGTRTPKGQIVKTIDVIVT